MAKLLKSYRDFTRGINTDAAPDNLLDNELARADNVDLSERGGMRKRNGEERLNKVSYGFPVEQLIEWPRDDGREILLAIVGTNLGYNNLCLVNEEGSTGDSGDSGDSGDIERYTLTVLCSVGKAEKVSTFYHRDKLYINDGTSYWEYDGETITKIEQSDAPTTLSVEAEHYPSTAPSISFSSQDTGVVKGPRNTEPGNHKVMVTFIDADNNESAGSPVGMEYANGYYNSASISNIPTGPTGTKKRHIYRGIDNYGFCHIGTINNNTDTTFTHTGIWEPWNTNYSPPLEGATYKCAYTYVSSKGFESEPSPIEKVKIKEGESIKWKLTKSEENEKIRLYRTEPNGEILKFIAETDADTETFHDYVREYGDVMKANNNLDDVRKCKYSCYHAKSMRCFFTGNPDDPSVVYFSEPGEPTKVVNTSIMYPTTGDGPSTGIGTFGDAVLVHFDNNSIWKWAGIDPKDDATWAEIPAGVSATSIETINLTPNSLSFLAQGAWVAMNPIILHYSSGMQPGEEVVRNLARKRVEKIIRNIADPKKAVSIFDARRQRSLLAYTSEGAVRNNYILVYDWSLDAFTRYTNIQANDLLCRMNGDILIATNGYILKFNDGYLQANGAPVRMDILSKAYNLDYPYHKKRITRLFMTLFNPETAESEVTVRVFVDGVLETELIETTLYDSFIWGDEWGKRWGSTNLVTTRTKVSESGHRVQLEFINEEKDEDGNPEDTPCIIYGIAFEFRPSRAKGTRL